MQKKCLFLEYLAEVAIVRLKKEEALKRYGENDFSAQRILAEWTTVKEWKNKIALKDEEYNINLKVWIEYMCTHPDIISHRCSSLYRCLTLYQLKIGFETLKLFYELIQSKGVANTEEFLLLNMDRSMFTHIETFSKELLLDSTVDKKEKAELIKKILLKMLSYKIILNAFRNSPKLRHRITEIAEILSEVEVFAVIDILSKIYINR